MKRMAILVLSALLLATVDASAAERKAAPAAPATGAKADTPQKLDINRATVEELLAIPGIGPRLAQDIVDLRAKKGSFKNIEELLEVRGVKQKKLEAIATHLVLVPAATTPGQPVAATSR